MKKGVWGEGPQDEGHEALDFDDWVFRREHYLHEMDIMFSIETFFFHCKGSLNRTRPDNRIYPSAPAQTAEETI
jgi:hypothetical protein